MIISISTMYVIPFPNEVSVNLGIGSSRILDLKKTKSLDDVEVYYILLSAISCMTSKWVSRWQQNSSKTESPILGLYLGNKRHF